MPKFSGRPQVYDRDALHSYLYSHANSRGVVRVHQELFAEEIGCGLGTLRRLLGELKLLGKIERVPGPGGVSHFRVSEPDGPSPSVQKKGKVRVPVWG